MKLTKLARRVEIEKADSLVRELRENEDSHLKLLNEPAAYRL